MNITVYSKPACVQCTATTRAMSAKGLSFKVIDLTLDDAAFKLVQALGYRQAPVVIAGDHHWAGFRPDMINTLVRVLSALLFYSSASGNTERFVRNLDLPAIRLPIAIDAPVPSVENPSVHSNTRTDSTERISPARLSRVERHVEPLR